MSASRKTRVRRGESLNRRERVGRPLASGLGKDDRCGWRSVGERNERRKEKKLVI